MSTHLSPSTLKRMDRAGRAGFVAKGAVYAIIGWYALEVVLGRGGAFLDKEDVAKKVELQPYGQVLLAVLGAGLACYALWRFVQAIVNPRGEDGWKGAAKRVGWAGSGIVHAALSFTVFQTLTGADDGRSSWLARALAQPGGRWAFVVAGLGMMGVGVFHLWRAYSASFAKKLEQSEMSTSERKWAIRLGRLGSLARGIVFPIIGGFFVRAGLDTDLSKAKGTAAALSEIARAPLGSMLLPLVAVGLIAYGALLAVNARYRRPFA
jgi:hypothetical protein